MTDAAPVTTGAAQGQRRQPEYAAILSVAALTYFVMSGDAASRTTSPLGLILNAALAIVIVALYVLRALRHADRYDAAILISVLLLTVGAAFSPVPRQTFDSVLGLLVFAGGLYLLRDVMARPVGRRFLLVAFMALSAVITLLTAARWLGEFVNWWSLSGWTLVPPLGMNYAAEPWGHRHDLALLLAMLYPAWWVGARSPLRMGVATVVGVVGLLLILVGGSRMVWISAVGAAAVVAVQWIGRRQTVNARFVMIPAGALGIALVVAAVSGIAGPITERLIGGASLAERTAMWGPLMEVFGDHPLFGNGLGSFPWALQLTNYFDTNSFSPRHPDSAVVQLMAEAGLLGLFAMGVVVIATARELLKGRSAAATFAMVAFGLAALGGNPTDFDFMAATAIGWVAYATPHQPAESVRESASRAGLVVRAASLACLVAIGLSFAATVAGSIAYSVARGEVNEGRLEGAIAPMRSAELLDPGLAIYARQLGTLYLLTDEPEQSVEALERAVRANPQDDLAWRTLALAYAESGDHAAASGAIDHAVEVQRSDATNLLLALRDRIGTGEDTTDIASEIVQAWPFVVITPEWQALTGDSGTEYLDSALQRWAEGKASPEPLLAQPLTLRGLLGGSTETPVLRESRLSPSLRDAYIAVMTCDPAARDRLSSASESDRRQATYWALAARQAGLDGFDVTAPARMYTIMTGDPGLESAVVWRLNPIDENGVRGSSADRWGYHRSPIDWPETQWDLPSPRSGMTEWFLAPRESVARMALADQLPDCIQENSSTLPGR